MKFSDWLQRPAVRNVLGVSVLMLAYYIPDRVSLSLRTGVNQFLPYVFIILLYGWILFHNRILFERLYLKGRKRAYFAWTGVMMLAWSLNMHFIIVYNFGDVDTLPKILSFWIFTVTGLGIYVLFRYRDRFFEGQGVPTQPPGNISTTTTFDFAADGKEYQIGFDKILYVESLENYIRLVTGSKIYLVRLSLKEAEQRLPGEIFLRVSRSQIINTSFIESVQQDGVKVKGQEFRIGKVYKKYVEERLKG